MYDISIIVPCYNAGKFLDLLIKDVLSQKIRIQLILVDDGSRDNTRQVIEKYSNQVTYIRTENCGAGHARNVGIMEAKADWIVFLDADDLLYYNSLDTKLLGFLSECYNNNIQVIYTPKSKADINLETGIKIEYPEEKIENSMPELEFWTCIYNKKFLLDEKIKFFEYREQDIETAFRYRVFSRAENIVKTNEIFFYLQRNNLESNTHTFDEYNLYKIKSLVYFELLKESNKDKEFLRDTSTHLALYFLKECLRTDKSRKQVRTDKKLIRNKLKEVNNTSKQDFNDSKEFLKYWLKYILILILYCIPTLRKSKNEEKEKSPIKIKSNEDIFQKLIEISAEINKGKKA